MHLHASCMGNPGSRLFQEDGLILQGLFCRQLRSLGPTSPLCERLPPFPLTLKDREPIRASMRAALVSARNPMFILSIDGSTCPVLCHSLKRVPDPLKLLLWASVNIFGPTKSQLVLECLQQLESSTSFDLRLDGAVLSKKRRKKAVFAGREAQLIKVADKICSRPLVDHFPLEPQS